ncbi:MAG: PQQ-binding-like beta-propeller repeat protein [candidate division WOR-3 bacterium]|nr:PQQ-binding-like beta-propeller repeat protein [candidate division WOR-3 bacterium]
MRTLILVCLLVCLVIFAGCPKGRAPSSPVISGPSLVFPGMPDTFTFVATDPDGSSIKYQINWGDNVISDWSAALASGEVLKLTHSYNNKGSYTIKCTAKNQKGKTATAEYPINCGIERWRWSLAPDPDEEFDCEVNSTAAIDAQDNIYFTCKDGHIHSLNRNGQERSGWPKECEDGFISSVAIAPNGTIYACDMNGKIYALNANGNILWTQTVDDEIVASPAVGRNSEIYIPTVNDGLYAYAANGSLMWHVPVIYGNSSVGIDAGNNLYVGSYDGYLFKLDTAGHIIWGYHTGNEIISSPTIMPNGNICFGDDNGKFYVLRPDSTLVLQTTIGTAISQSAVIGSDGAIYMTTDDGQLIKFNANLTEMWTFDTYGGFCSSPAVVNYPNIGDVIYFTASWAKKNKSFKRIKNRLQDDYDSLYIIRASDGRRLDACGIPQISGYDVLVSSPTVGADGTIYIGGGPAYDNNNNQIARGFYAYPGRGVVVNSSWPLFRQNTKNTGRIGN